MGHPGVDCITLVINECEWMTNITYSLKVNKFYKKHSLSGVILPVHYSKKFLRAGVEPAT